MHHLHERSLDPIHSAALTACQTAVSSAHGLKPAVTQAMYLCFAARASLPCLAATQCHTSAPQTQPVVHSPLEKQRSPEPVVLLLHSQHLVARLVVHLHNSTVAAASRALRHGGSVLVVLYESVHALQRPAKACRAFWQGCTCGSRMSNLVAVWKSAAVGAASIVKGFDGGHVSS